MTTNLELPKNKWVKIKAFGDVTTFIIHTTDLVGYCITDKIFRDTYSKGDLENLNVVTYKLHKVYNSFSEVLIDYPEILDL